MSYDPRLAAANTPPARPPHRRSSTTSAQRGTFFRLRVLDDQQAPVCHYDGKRVINLASQQLPRPLQPPQAREAAIAATTKYGVGSGAVRTIAGTMRIHMELEEKIAAFKGVEACVVFQSGFAANAGTVSTHPRQGRLHPLRRAQPRQHHRRRAPLPRQDQSLPPQGRRPRRRAAEGSPERARPQARHHRRRLLHGRRHRPRRRARRPLPKSTAPS